MNVQLTMQLRQAWFKRKQLAALREPEVVSFYADVCVIAEAKLKSSPHSSNGWYLVKSLRWLRRLRTLVWIRKKNIHAYVQARVLLEARHRLELGALVTKQRQHDFKVLEAIARLLSSTRMVDSRRDGEDGGYIPEDDIDDLLF